MNDEYTWIEAQQVNWSDDNLVQKNSIPLIYT